MLATCPVLRHDDQVIAVASYPADLSSWNQADDPYYLEVYGEAEPALDMTHAEVLPPGGSTAQTTAATPIYEYWWTIGHGGTKPEHRHLFESRKRLDLWHRLENIAARIYLYFPIAGGWRVQELAASAKYLAPVAHQSRLDRKSGIRVAADAADRRRGWPGGLGARRRARSGNSRGWSGTAALRGVEAAVRWRAPEGEGLRLVRGEGDLRCRTRSRA